MKAAPPAPAAPGFGRIPISDVWPALEGGAYPAKAVIDELLTFRATVFREGHDAVGADVVLTAPDGSVRRVAMRQVEPIGLDIWEAEARLDALGDWSFHLEGYSDHWHTWAHNAHIKWPIGEDTDLVCLEGADLYGRAVTAALAAGDPESARLLERARDACVPGTEVAELLDWLDNPAVGAAMGRHAPRDFPTPTRDYPIRVQRRRALFSAWYEFFPRSQGAHYDEASDKWISGTFDDCHALLERIAGLGFDVVYVPPIHPVGTTFRKGHNNTLTPEHGDPGSPWAIGAPEGGHDAVHPDLGGLPAFERFVAKAKAVGLEVALDFALQASPDHPWLQDHPEWFTTRLDGTIAYAENPPKKYQDIYPINFDNDPAGIRAEVLRLLEFWIAKGVTIFRVDNPHTKPLNFWADILEKMNSAHPEVLFLSEAFTRPAMMQALAGVGFHQSYTYFVWRTTKRELTDYLNEVSHLTSWVMRPNFWPNTPDINPRFTQSGKASAFSIRLLLAATMSPSWGMYSGFELLEHTPFRPGGEEYLDSEKYEYRPRDFEAAPNLNRLLGRINEIRRAHPALQQLRTTTVLGTSSDDLFAFSKRDGADAVIVVVTLNPDWPVEGQVDLDLAALGRPAGTSVRVRDELTGIEHTWGAHNYVRLSPAQVAHIFTVID
ncbi:MAG: alpha-1,4-glucan--maltose-1-phosphate maltosyltransferase [Actinomycetia bacterium]|nr:alpha-1,4-glucan--maltose-1-phosphate maltosyltransferase [Actinomycetes bacterium]